MGVNDLDLVTYAYEDPYWVYGDSIISRGLKNRFDIHGVGLVTRGLVWLKHHIYDNLDEITDIDTLWSSWEAPLSTVWVSAEPVITTTWTPVDFGTWGDGGIS